MFACLICEIFRGSLQRTLQVSGQALQVLTLVSYLDAWEPGRESASSELWEGYRPVARLPCQTTNFDFGEGSQARNSGSTSFGPPSDEALRSTDRPVSHPVCAPT